MTEYWAHSSSSDRPENSREGWQRLSDHLVAVGNLAAQFALAARPSDRRFANDAELCGILHDYGKYTDCFQKMLESGRGKCQHAIHGAMLAYFGEADARNFGSLPIALAIAGHHAGLFDEWELTGAKFNEERYQAERRSILDRARNDLPRLRQAIERLSSAPLPPVNKSKQELYTRMLFSCLVDADRLDSARREALQVPLAASRKLEQLLLHLRGLSDTSPGGILKQMRQRVLDDCLGAAERPGKLFSLSVPTSGGKTLASMAFALKRATLFDKDFRRVIVVIPFLSIIEQNADVYAKVFGSDALLEHHSGSLMKLKVSQSDPERFVPAGEDGEEQQFQTSGYRSETENWDSPLIVTTSVRFFESLFSNRPKDLRRVHNIARSIVILDEVQTLPRNLIGPLLGMMKELTEDWGVNFVFSTATLPAFQRENSLLLWEPGTLDEIVSDLEPLRTVLKRAEIAWEIDSPTSWSQIAGRALTSGQSLTIVNLRDHARELFETVCSEAEERGLDTATIFHLSTRMCAAHRLRAIEIIRERLKDGLPCHVVSTQLIEAGVDLDFPIVFRALAPLDSILQAAGRADREGKLTAELGRPGGSVVVFRSPDGKTPPNEYAEATCLTGVLAEERRGLGASIQVDDPRAMSDYFLRYYGNESAQLGERLVQFREQRKFKTLAEEFEMISNRTKDVYVPHDEDARVAIAELREAKHITRELHYRLQRSIVGLGPWEFDKARAAGVVEELFPGSEVWIAFDHAYDKRLGLKTELNPETFVP